MPSGFLRLITNDALKNAPLDQSAACSVFMQS
jgi:hypothetical protein